MSAALRLLAVLPVLLALGWAASSAVSALRADSLARQAATEMSTWSAAGVQPAPETRESVHAMLREASALRPDDAATHELMGLLGTMQRDEPRRMDEGIAHLVEALEHRPVSPYTWAYLLEARYLRGEAAAELELPLSRAVELGPTEGGVQRLVADYGLALWPELSPGSRAAVDRMVAAGMRRNPLEMLRISDRRGRLEAACRHVLGAPKPDPRVGRACERWEITP